MWTRKGDWLECTIPSFWSGLTIEQLLKDVWTASKKLVHRWRMEHGVKLNGQAVLWKTVLNERDRLQLYAYEPEPSFIVPEYRELSILWEDDHLLVLNKEAGIDIHPSEPGQTGTLANAVAFHLQSQAILTKVRHIHRLDRDTSGAILFAKHPLAGATLDQMLAHRAIKRTYVALVHGRLSPKSGTISAPIGRDRHHPTRRRVSKTGAKAVTHYRVIKTFPSTSLVELSLETGRTHQIRVHLAHLGHPLVGDVLYGGKPLFHRHALHAMKLMFRHPFTNEEVMCLAPTDDFPIDLSPFYS
ncbi:RluA family pseudouridine synthase [Geobacillus sp. TFV-3]|uniref:RluA family pseudouridine synthase n=1 Tax=Geobacillus sp. TFV-3 TaxID=1897059 RepID=UPI00135C5348|nr:RluA family pseudouridine synthase [Geobacillus sp. TFV-3]KAF0996215.1 Ribosomal large subunit pseudouridine synthase D [Geobacillus sp. TFV-3]